MYCRSCGTEVSENFRYCPQCGASIAGSSFISKPGAPSRVLSRPRDNRKIAGVCAGIARYLGMDVTLVRVLMLVFAVWPPGVGLIVYLACWIIMPRDPLLLPPAQEASQGQSVTITP